MTGTPAKDLGPRVTARRLLTWLAIGTGCVLVVAAICSVIGQLPVQTGGVWQNRLMRLSTAGAVGACLAVSGMALQALLRNPLAEPYILGISSGAGVGVALGKLWGPSIAATLAADLAGWLTTPVLAIAGALATCLVVYGIAQRRGRLDPYVLLLSGVIVNVFNSALMLIILLFSPANTALDIVSWGFGHIPDLAGWRTIAAAAAVISLGWTAIFARAWAFNALGLGDAVAASSGVAVHRLRVQTFLIVGVITSVSVALAGPIGFVGLMVPHVCRMVLGPDHRQLALVSGFAGAIFLMIADTICRTAGGYLGIGEIPVGVLTCLCGGPFFIYLLRAKSSGGRL